MAGTVQEEVDGHIGVDTILGVVNDKAHFHANCAFIKPGLARILGSAPFAAASRHIPHGMCVVAAILHVTELLLQLFKAVQVWKEMLNFRKTSEVLRVRRLGRLACKVAWHAGLLEPRSELIRVDQGGRGAGPGACHHLPQPNSAEQLRVPQVVVLHRRGREVALEKPLGGQSAIDCLAVGPAGLHHEGQQAQPHPGPELGDGVYLLEVFVPKVPAPGEGGTLPHVVLNGVLQREVGVPLQEP
mmetsp:Transcript_134855/g.319689  ORF Transcript_134855/g.319689 Transcript_134855/m.319689 type:complete len:243 (+) Transcript_134855:298-1026(+)